MEEIPRALAQTEEFLAFLALRLGGVAAGSEGTAASRGRAVAEGWRAAILVLGARAATAGARATVRGIVVLAVVVVGATVRRWCSRCRCCRWLLPRGHVRGMLWLGRGRRRRLVASVVHQPRQQLGSAAGQLHLRLLGRLVLPWPDRRRRLLLCWLLGGHRRVAWGRERTPAAVGEHVVPRRIVRVAGHRMANNIGDRWQAVVGLICRYMVDVRGAGKVRGLVRDVPCQGVRVVSAGECLSERRGLDDALVGKLLVRRRNNGQAGLIPTRQAGRLGDEVVAVVVLRTVDGSIASLSRLLLQPRFDNVPLLFPHGHAALELLLHDRVLRHKAGREAGQANLLDAQATAFARRERATSSHG